MARLSTVWINERIDFDLTIYVRDVHIYTQSNLLSFGKGARV